jgi:tRNA G18 (ribose-2'-O)-methylase SpoU
VEGRQAVRELLIAGRRKVREVWMVDEGDDAPILGDIRDLAAGARVSVLPVSKGRFAAQARCEAPQGVLALAAPLPRPTSTTWSGDGRRSWSPWTASPTPATWAPSCARPSAPE